MTDGDAAIASALEDLSIPTRMLSLVHMTGDPKWIRGDIKPQGLQEMMSWLVCAEVPQEYLPRVYSLEFGSKKRVFRS